MKFAIEKTYTVNLGNYESYKLTVRYEDDSSSYIDGDDMEPEVFGAVCIQIVDSLAHPQLAAIKAKAARDSFIQRL